MNKKIISSALITISTIIAYVPLPNQNKTLNVVIGSELEEPLAEIEKTFEQNYPDIQVNLKIQGSQDIVNNIINQKNDFQPAIVIPASDELISQLETRLRAIGQEKPFYNNPQPIAKTLLVAIAWQERGNILFPNNQFNWQQLEQALISKNWQDIGGNSNWGSFDLLMTDPTRSNSGQLTLNLWAENKLNQNTLAINNLANNEVEQLFSLLKNSVYQPPRSTDILLQEFIVRGENDADVGLVYESIALYRWSQTNQNKVYQIYYPNPTTETFSTAVILNNNLSQGEQQSAEKFIDYLLADNQQITLAKYGFRPINNNINLTTINDTPWSNNILGMEINPPVEIKSSPSPEIINEIQKVWLRN
ncbi:hypothetical protein AA637_03650 [Cyanobacterium sp. HL-69]|uniref:substrate-binding domain-containing protein n=1 Tax=Cyanobacterium sp. HL-69 TaxID=2054282 RepID=UPI000CA099B5|nr:hypothetical protein AA637_03650 [Cyanobacterium sp. HL-69]